MNYTKQEIESMLGVDFSDGATEKQSYKTLKSSQVNKKSWNRLKSKNSASGAGKDSGPQEQVNVDTNVLKKWGHASDLKAPKYPEGFRGHYQEHQINNIRAKMEGELKKMSIYSNDD